MVIDDLEIWLVAEDNLIDDSLLFAVISEGDLMHNCSILLLVIDDFEIWLVAEDNLVDD